MKKLNHNNAVQKYLYDKGSKSVGEDVTAELPAHKVRRAGLARLAGKTLLPAVVVASGAVGLLTAGSEQASNSNSNEKIQNKADVTLIAKPNETAWGITSKLLGGYDETKGDNDVRDQILKSAGGEVNAGEEIQITLSGSALERYNEQLKKIQDLQANQP